MTTTIHEMLWNARIALILVPLALSVGTIWIALQAAMQCDNNTAESTDWALAKDRFWWAVRVQFILAGLVILGSSIPEPRSAASRTPDPYRSYFEDCYKRMSNTQSTRESYAFCNNAAQVQAIVTHKELAVLRPALQIPDAPK